MNYKLAIELRDGYIYAETEGYETLENSIAVYQKIADKCQQWQCERVVYVEGFVSQISVAEMCLLFDSIVSRIKRDELEIRFAFYDRKTIHDRENAIGETLAGCQGINAKVFFNLDEAIEWIQAC